MEKGLIGVQMMMLKKQVQENGIYSVLTKLDEIGYHAVEVSQIEMTPAVLADIQRACASCEMEVVAMSCGVEDLSAQAKYPGSTLQNDFDQIVSDCQAVQCHTLRIGMLPINCMETKASILAFARRCDEYARRLKLFGIDLYYHSHHMEFFCCDGELIIDTMRNNTECLGFELDSHWMWRGGVDPVRFIPRFKGRIKLLHLKDYRIGPVTLDAYPGVGMEKIRYMLTDIVQYAEVGEGTLDFPAIIQCGLECGSEFFLIEQDNLYGRDVYDCLRISRDNLIRMGFGDWFTR